jgi:hypothetical protein
VLLCRAAVLARWSIAGVLRMEAGLEEHLGSWHGCFGWSGADDSVSVAGSPAMVGEQEQLRAML